MPSNNHRIVKTHARLAKKPVSLAAALTGVLAAALCASAAILSGGLGLGALGLFVIGPVLVGLIWGRRAIVGAVLAALLGIGGLWVMQGNGLLPPALIDRQSILVSAQIGWPLLYVFSVLWRVRKAPSKPPSRNAQDASQSDMVAPKFDPQVSDWLLVEVSPLDRVRRVLGARDLIPGLRPGREASGLLVNSKGLSLTAGPQKLSSGDEIIVTEAQQVDGRVIMIVKTGSLEAVHSETMEQELRDRTNFFAGLGHDLKSPLNAVIGFADMMESEISGPMPEAYQEYPGLIKESGQTLLRLVEDMLAFARSEAGTYEIDPAPMDVVSSGETVMRQSQAEAARAGVELEMHAGGEVIANADARAVQRIWDNLVSNAIKYSNKGQTVTLAAKSSGKNVELSVSDHGAGMDADDLERIAKPFSQGQNSQGRAGTGLGLAMVKRLADMHGGQVVIRTAPGEGTHISVTLPAAEQQRKAAE